MENATNFLASLGRFSCRNGSGALQQAPCDSEAPPSSHFFTPQAPTQHHRDVGLVEGLAQWTDDTCELGYTDETLDAFGTVSSSIDGRSTTDTEEDQELLRDNLEERPWQGQHGPTRLVLPPITGLSPHLNSNPQTIQDKLFHVLPQNYTSSSSPGGAPSSPTVSALLKSGSQVRRQNKTVESVPRLVQVHSPTDALVDLTGAPPSVQGISLVPSADLPDRFRALFKYPIFNAIQSKCFPVAFGSQDNLVLSSPTGSGKTLVMELAICQLIASCKVGAFKIVYQAPTKSLCAERYRDWQARFGALLDLQCAELTGDTEYEQLRRVQSASIIITTPEKWDSVTRKWKDNARLMEMVRLFLIDEVHILKESRGATLEAIVSRMKSIGTRVRFVALSATVPNSEDVATWLGKNSEEQHLPACREVFGEELRPVQLQKLVKGYLGSCNDFAFEKRLSQEISSIIATHARKKPVMIFCFTRKAAIQTSKMLAELWIASSPPTRLWHGPRQEIRVMDTELRAMASAAVAFHHGGLEIADRRAVEEGFLIGDINVICSTSTLAVGVNLPCYLVIIKGTMGWSDSGAQEYSDLEVMQMLGRAGRPQYERSACAVIMTRHETVRRYERMVSGEERLESCLHQNLIDHLNAEIGLGSVYDLVSAQRWLAGTFLFVRLRKNPSHYRLEEDVGTGEDEWLKQTCERHITLLRESKLVSEHGRLTSTEFGDAMTRYYVKYETMKLILSLPPRAKVSEILSVLARASEFRDVRFKAGEKGLYKELNKDISIRFPIKVDVALPAHKVSLLLQSELGGCGYPSDRNDSFKKHKSQYQIDKAMVFSHINRLIRCIIDCQIYHKDSVSVRHSLELARSLAARLWENTSLQLKQLEGIGEVGVRKLAAAGISSIEMLEHVEAQRIETIFNRNPPFGNKILSKALEFPKLRVTVKQTGKERDPGISVRITIKAEVGFLNERMPFYFRGKPIYICFLAETADGILIDFRRFAAKKLQNSQSSILLMAQLRRPSTRIKCYVMCDDIAGTSKCAELELEEMPLSWFLPAEAAQTTAKPGDGNRMNVKLVKDSSDFGDDDLDDSDLVAAAAEENNTEVVEDIDEIMAEEGHYNTMNRASRKRSASQILQGGEEGEKSWREPLRLGNGRWTCQHDCNDVGKNCKHPCCRDGVAKRQKAPKRKVPIDHDGVGMTETPKPGRNHGQKKIPFECAQESSEEKKRRRAVPAASDGTALNDPHSTVERSQPVHAIPGSLPKDRNRTSMNRKVASNVYSNDLSIDSLDLETDLAKVAGVEELPDTETFLYTGKNVADLRSCNIHGRDIKYDTKPFNGDKDLWEETSADGEAYAVNSAVRDFPRVSIESNTLVEDPGPTIDGTDASIVLQSMESVPSDMSFSDEGLGLHEAPLPTTTIGDLQRKTEFVAPVGPSKLAGKAESSEIGIRAERKEEMQGRSKEEEQMKKWEGIDDEWYEFLKGSVELD